MENILNLQEIVRNFATGPATEANFLPNLTTTKLLSLSRARENSEQAPRQVAA